MKTAALTVAPGVKGSTRLETIDVPGSEDGLLIEMTAVGVCGTDREIVSGLYGTPPPGRDRLVLGHESLGRVAEALSNTPFSGGDLVVGVNGRCTPVPAAPTAHRRGR